ncbi:MAG: glycoside hydrolase family 38 C-terminal domain-containing protein [Pseudomonadota bacterium]
MGGRWPFTAEKIEKRLALIKPLIHRQRRDLPPFRILPLDEADVYTPIDGDPGNWPEIPHNSYWGSADLNFLMKSALTIPAGWNTGSMALHLPLGVLGDIFNHPEALVHVDGKLVGSADRYHHTIPISASLAVEVPHDLSLLGWTGLAGWPPDPKSAAKLFMGRPALIEVDQTLKAFYDLAETALDASNVLDPASSEHLGILQALDRAFVVLDTRDPLGDAFYDSVAPAHACLQEGIAAAGEPLDKTLHGIGHAHMDIAYLWPISQIRLKNARTYSNVLRLMDDEPLFNFSHSQPQLYAMVEEDYPEIFATIRERVAEGRWEVMGGMWVEPDLNIPGPEALVQQLILGRKYYKEHFGDAETPILWLPDTFGFPAQIPQLMRHAGLKWFATNKLNWNQKNMVPWSTHHWEALDGSRVIAHVLTTPRDVQYLPFPTNYKSDLSASEVLGTIGNRTIPPEVMDLPICYGYGDGGGGPTSELLAKARAFEAMPGMPQFKMSTVKKTFEKLEEVSESFHVWRGEHYMEGHRGVLTSQGWIKRANRKAERALHEAEALSAIAGLKPDLKKAWELLCLNQFHDIITGTSIAEVFDDARQDYERISDIIERETKKATDALGSSMPAVANTSPVSGPRVIDGPDGAPLHFERLEAYSVTPLAQASKPSVPVSIQEAQNVIILENEHIRAEINEAGQLVSVLDKALSRKVLDVGACGNQLQAFEDRPICWDAWDIDPHFEDRQEVVATKCDIEVVEAGPLRATVRFKRSWRRSLITQEISLSASARRIDFQTDIDWHEQHTLLKAAFPTSVSAEQAQFDIQWGRVNRSTKRESSFDAARFEVAAQKWAKLTDEDMTIAVLNDCKYGYDIANNTIRITLIKSATAPDPNADQGRHYFTYSLYVGPSESQQLLDHEAYSLNTIVRLLPADGSAVPTGQPFVSTNAPNIIIETVKTGMSGDLIVRMYEMCGTTTRARVLFGKTVNYAAVTDFFEKETEKLGVKNGSISVDFKPFEIRTLKLAVE